MQQRATIGMGLLLLMAVFSGACGGGPTSEEVAAEGQAQVERLSDSVFTAEIDLAQWTPQEPPLVTAGHVNADDGTLFSGYGQTPTTYRWTYDLAADVTIDEALDAAVAELERLGATHTGSWAETTRQLEATDGPDDLSIDIRSLMGPDTLTVEIKVRS